MQSIELIPETETASTDAGLGALQTERGCLPLKSMDVRAAIAGLHATATIKQSFVNVFETPLAAVYIFPLPERAAVVSFKLRVAGRIVDGVLEEQAKARAEYDKAIEAGHRAAIAEEERSGVFHLRVGNLPPGETAEVELSLVGPLSIADGEATFRFPLVVAPRYIPGTPLPGPSVGEGVAPDTDAVPDASRISPPVLLPGFPSPIRLSFEVAFDPCGLAEPAGGWAANLHSSLHAILAEAGPPFVVRLQPAERLNRDFLLRFPIARDLVQTILSFAPGDDGVFALSLLPQIANAAPKPRDVVFLLDRSGSMGGWKMVAARRAVARMIDTLNDRDRFSVLAFDNRLETDPIGDGALTAATNQARWRTLEWLGKIDSRGGTEMEPAIAAALKLLCGDATRDRVVVFLTDGQVGNEDSLLRAVGRVSALPRFFTVGIDRAVNAGLLQKLADMGRGRCELVESEDRLDQAMDRIHRSLATPILTDVQIEAAAGARISALAPTRIPDLFDGCPITVFGLAAASDRALRLQVRATCADGSPWRQEVAAQPAERGLLLPLWGRARVRDLEDRYAAGLSPHADAAEEIVDVSLKAGVLSRFTAFLAVDRSEVVNAGGIQHRVLQPVETPAGWDGAGMGPSLAGALCTSLAAAPSAVPAMAKINLTRRSLRPFLPARPSAARNESSATPAQPPLAADAIRALLAEGRRAAAALRSNPSASAAGLMQDLQRTLATLFAELQNQPWLQQFTNAVRRLLRPASQGARLRTWLAKRFGVDVQARERATLENYLTRVDRTLGEIADALNLPPRSDGFWK